MLVSGTHAWLATSIAASSLVCSDLTSAVAHEVRVALDEHEWSDHQAGACTSAPPEDPWGEFEPDLGPPQPTAGPPDVVPGPLSADEDGPRVAPGSRKSYRNRAGIRTQLASVPEAHTDASLLWHLGGFVDTVYAFSPSFPANHLNRGSGTQPRLNEFSVNHVAFYVRKAPREGAWDWTIELAAQAGPAPAALVANEVAIGGTSGAFAGPNVWQHIGRANVGFRAPRGAEFSAGLHSSPIGVGLHWTVYNWNVTTSWELNSVPYYLPGLRYRQPLDRSGRHALETWIVNGWQLAAENNAAPSGVFAYIFTPRPDLTISEYTWVGPETASISPDTWRLFSNTQFVWNRDRVGLTGLFDIGGDGRHARGGQRFSTWLTSAFSARWLVVKRGVVRWDMAARAEAFWDSAGRIYGEPRTTLVAGTITQALRVVEHLMLRLEYRYDHALGPQGFFYYRNVTTPAAGGLAQNQHLILLNVAAQFDLALGR